MAINNLKRIGIVLSIILNIAFVGGYLYKTLWQGEEEFSPVKPGLREIAKGLQLSDEQREKINQSTESLVKEIAKIRAKIRDHRKAMIALLTSPNPDRQAIELKRQEIASLQGNIQKLVLDKMLEDKNILTPEQQRKLFSYLREKAGSRIRGGDWMRR